MNIFQNDFVLVDIWRLRHPTLRRFTRRQKAVGGFVQSRLDFWLVSSHLNSAINKVEIHPGRRSDHSIISLAIQSQDVDTRGRGFWKLNTSLLQDSAYVEKIRDCIARSKVKYSEVEDKRTLWDLIKCEIRAETLTYSIHKSKASKQMEKELVELIKDLEIQLADDPSDDLVAEYNVVKTELDNILSIKRKGAMLRSKARWVEEGETNTAYFLKLENINQKLKSINLLHVGDKRIIGRNDILDEELKCYQNLYAKEENANTQEIEDTFLGTDQELPTLSETEKENGDKNITLLELNKALKELPNGKSPGSD